MTFVTRQIWAKLRPQGFLRFQNGGAEGQGNPDATDVTNNIGIFCHLIHDKMAFSELMC